MIPQRTASADRQSLSLAFVLLACASAVSRGEDSTLNVIKHAYLAQQSKLSSAPHGRADAKLTNNSGASSQRTEHSVEWDADGRVRWSGEVTLSQPGSIATSQFEAVYDKSLNRLEIIRHIDGMGRYEIQQPMVALPSWLRSTPTFGWFSVTCSDLRITLDKAVAWRGSEDAKREVVRDESAKELTVRISETKPARGDIKSEITYDLAHDLLFKRGAIQGIFVGDCVWAKNAEGIIIPRQVAWTGPTTKGPPSQETWAMFATYANVDLRHQPASSRFKLSLEILKPGSAVVQILKGEQRMWRIGDDDAPSLDRLLEQAGDEAAGSGLAEGFKP